MSAVLEKLTTLLTSINKMAKFSVFLICLMVYSIMGEKHSRNAKNSVKISNNSSKFDPDFNLIRYINNNQFCYKPGCPIVIYVGGEWPIDEGPLISGPMFNIAHDNGAAMFYLEHRFYGKSFPNYELTQESLRLLHTSQAMEDLKGFILWLKSSDLLRDSKVVLFGCSYTGGLVAWMQAKHPELIDAIYSSSGPVWFRSNIYEYNQVVSKIIYESPEVGPSCADLIHQGISELETEFDEGDEGMDSVFRKLRACKPRNPNREYDKPATIGAVISHFQGVVQLDPKRITMECVKLLNSFGNTASEILVNYFNASPEIAKHSNEPCAYSIKAYDQSDVLYVNASSDKNTQLWLWQQCNEFGNFQTTETDKQIFGHSVLRNFGHEKCRRAFGDKYTDKFIVNKIEETNRNYGGRSPNVRKAVFLYGTLDPWAPFGVDRDLNEEAIRISIEGGGHCQDLLPSNAEDSQSMIMARRRSAELIKKWLNE